MLPRRLHFQSLARPRFEHAEAVVEWLGAVQAQDFPAAKWAVAQRTTGADDARLEQAFNAGTIVRTHVLRPTWHLVPARDIRWMLELSSRVRATMAQQGRWLGFDAAVYPRATRIIAKALAGGQSMTRPELGALLGQRGVALGNVLIRAELDGLICSGPLRGKHHTFALLDERVPATPPITRAAALALLARRYFRSHGPATFKDFVWWSGLSVAEAKQAIAGASGLVAEVIGGTMHWLSDRASGVARAGRVHLLPNFDEYLVAYADRSAHDGRGNAKSGGRGNAIFMNTVVLDGRVVGTWKRTITARTVGVDVTLFARVPTAALEREVQRFGAFLGRTASFHVSPLPSSISPRSSRLSAIS